MFYRILTLLISVLFIASGVYATTVHQGGYYATDSDEPDCPGYDWINITGTGTVLTFENPNQDNTKSTVSTPFKIRLFDTLYLQGGNLSVSSNGFLTFGSGAEKYVNKDIPNIATPDAYISPFWDDLYGYTTSSPPAKVYMDTRGSTPNRQWIFSFEPWYRKNYPNNSITFQMIIFESPSDSIRNSILFQYKDVECGNNNFNWGASATVGLEDFPGTQGTKYSFNSPTLGATHVIYFVDGPNHAKPTNFSLLLPENLTVFKVPAGETTVDFEWEPSYTGGTGAITYELWVDDNENFNSPLWHLNGLTSTTINLSFTVTDDVTYFWRVKARENQFGGTTLCNEDFTFSFDVDENISVTPASLGNIKATFH